MNSPNQERDDLHGTIISALAASIDYAKYPRELEKVLGELIEKYIDTNTDQDCVEVLIGALLQFSVELGSSVSGGQAVFREQLRNWVPGYSLGGIPLEGAP